MLHAENDSAVNEDEKITRLDEYTDSAEASFAP